MDQLHTVAAVLMEREKISGDEFKTLMEGGKLPPFDLGSGKTARPDPRTPRARPGPRGPGAARNGRPGPRSPPHPKHPKKITEVE